MRHANAAAKRIKTELKTERDEEREAKEDAQELAGQLYLSENAKMSEIDQLKATIAERDATIDQLQATITELITSGETRRSPRSRSAQVSAMISQQRGH